MNGFILGANSIKISIMLDKCPYYAKINIVVIN